MIRKLKEDIRKLANPKKAKVYQRFFKTGIGEYGEGDIFLGLTVPQSRKIAIKYKDLDFPEIKKLLQSKMHEERLIAVLLLVYNFNEGDEKGKGETYDFYLANTKYINNWDLVDLSAYKIVGQYLMNKSKNILFNLSRSKNIWERRISIIATYQFIKSGRYQETLRISKILLRDEHDLIQKAVGWMLREVGKNCSKAILEEFLKRNYKKMPRTILRYAIERFPEKLRKKYLQSKI